MRFQNKHLSACKQFLHLSFAFQSYGEPRYKRASRICCRLARSLERCYWTRSKNLTHVLLKLSGNER